MNKGWAFISHKQCLRGMPLVFRKKTSAACLPVALLPQSDLLFKQIEQGDWRQNRVLARKLINSLSESEIKTLSAELRQQLTEVLKAGRITNADSKAIKKLVLSEVEELEYQRRMVIKGDKNFINATIAHLSNISRIPLGKKLLNSLCESGKQITIIATDRVSEAPPDDFRAAIPKGRHLTWRDLSGKEVILKGNGRGSSTTIRYNPAFIFSCRTATWKKCPPEIALAHELIHADDSAYGRLDPDEINGVRNYERQAVGLIPYENKEFTENKFRATWLPPISPRAQY